MLSFKWQTALCICVALFVLGWIIGSHTTYKTYPSYTTYRERHDTAHTIIAVPLKPITVRASTNRTKTIRIHDTPYAARCLDTIMQHDSTSDTLSICYARDVFSVALHFGSQRVPVTIPYIARDSIITQVLPITRPWYEDVLMVLVSVAAGIVMAKL